VLSLASLLFNWNRAMSMKKKPPEKTESNDASLRVSKRIRDRLKVRTQRCVGPERARSAKTELVLLPTDGADMLQLARPRGMSALARSTSNAGV
jgi:hypothetical protein